MTYCVAVVSFAVLHAMIFYRDPHAYGLSAAAPHFFLSDALYFSFTMITTTGYGDIIPVSALARTVACGEMAVGLLYQITVFSLLAAIVDTNDILNKKTGQ